MTRRRKRKHRSIENPNTPLTSPNILAVLGAGLTTSSGENVSPQRALTYSPVWAATAIISNDISRLPFLVYKRTADGRGKERDRKHPAHRLLRRNVGDQTSNLWLARMVGHSLLYGDAYSIIHRDRLNRIVALEWVHSDDMMPKKDGGVRFYLHRPMQGRVDRLPAVDVFHLPGLLLDELGGLSIVQYARNTIGRMLASEGFGDDFFANNGVLSGFFKHPGEMSQQAMDRFTANFRAAHAGAGRRFKTGILEEGMSYEHSGVTPEDALLVEFLQWGPKDVSRYFSIPPHKLGDDSRVSYNSLEQEEKAYFGSTLGTWVSRLEFEANDKLFTTEEIEDESHFAEFEQNAWNKADIDARYQAYAIGVTNGWLSRNEVRAFENLNPVEGLDEYLVPLNMGKSNDEPEDDEQDESTPVANAESDDRAKVALRDVLIDRLAAAARLISNAAARASRKPNTFLKWIDGLASKHGEAVRGMVGPAVRAIGKPVDPVVESLLSRAINELLAATECQPDQLEDNVRRSAEVLRRSVTELADDLVYEGSEHAV